MLSNRDVMVSRTLIGRAGRGDVLLIASSFVGYLLSEEDTASGLTFRDLRNLRNSHDRFSLARTMAFDRAGPCAL
jgi:hypothetical protein